MYCTSCGYEAKDTDNFCQRCGAAVAAGPARQEQPPAGVFVNGRELTREQMVDLQSAYRFAPPAGRYWYDSMSGAWGFEGRESAGLILPGHDYGPLSGDASGGNTGVFINGRELNQVEAANLQRTLGAVYPGRWWLDGRTGNFGMEGNPFPLGNIAAALQTQQRGASGGDNFWSTGYARGNDDGQSGYISIDGVTYGYDH